ncbi:MAG: N-acetylmuramic acid 6-phosphate etherase [Elusimicrobia bacterium]|nr:N-acetylmuramic acid 6-phosphate etherase [Elusimicrobiota bacterium]
MGLRAGEYGRLPTEQPNPRTRGIDRLSTIDVVRRLNAEDARVAPAVAREAKEIARAADAIAQSLAAGGRLFFFGAGTSGRLGVLEAAECPPTFSTPPSLVVGVIAGGKGSMFKAREGAEDDERDGRRQAARRARRGDVLVGIAASGVTPFVLGALAEGRRLGCRTVLISSNRRPAGSAAEIVISPQVAPEALSGSTRLKSGTAAKLVLNSMTTAAMIRLGKVYDHWMVDLRPTNHKLRLRAERMTADLAGVSPAKAKAALRRAGGGVKLAILCLKTGLAPARGEALLRAAEGSLRAALEAA